MARSMLAEPRTATAGTTKAPTRPKVAATPGS